MQTKQWAWIETAHESNRVSKQVLIQRQYPAQIPHVMMFWLLIRQTCQFFQNYVHPSRRNPMGLIIALNDNSTAKGSLFWDDGDSIGKLCLAITVIPWFPLLPISFHSKGNVFYLDKALEGLKKCWLLFYELERFLQTSHFNFPAN